MRASMCVRVCVSLQCAYCVHGGGSTDCEAAAAVKQTHDPMGKLDWSSFLHFVVMIDGANTFRVFIVALVYDTKQQGRQNQPPDKNKLSNTPT